MNHIRFLPTLKHITVLRNLRNMHFHICAPFFHKIQELLADDILFHRECRFQVPQRIESCQPPNDIEDGGHVWMTGIAEATLVRNWHLHGFLMMVRTASFRDNRTWSAVVAAANTWTEKAGLHRQLSDLVPSIKIFDLLTPVALERGGIYTILTVFSPRLRSIFGKEHRTSLPMTCLT